MIKVKLVVVKGSDIILGHINEDGTIYRSQAGLNDRIGRVDLSSGKVYEDQFGPDKKVGHVNMKNGKVYSSRLGLDKHLGNVNGKGHMLRLVHMGIDTYVGMADPFVSYAHTGGAMLLLVIPALEGPSANKTAKQS